MLSRMPHSESFNFKLFISVYQEYFRSSEQNPIYSRVWVPLLAFVLNFPQRSCLGFQFTKLQLLLVALRTLQFAYESRASDSVCVYILKMIFSPPRSVSFSLFRVALIQLPIGHLSACAFLCKLVVEPEQTANEQVSVLPGQKTERHPIHYLPLIIFLLCLLKVKRTVAAQSSEHFYLPTYGQYSNV